MHNRAAGDRGRDEGIARSSAAQERIRPQWSDRAVMWLNLFLVETVGPFTSPDFRAWCVERSDLEAPKSNLAWGGVFRRAASQSMIEKCGVTTYGDETMHTQNVTQWQRTP